MSNHKGEDTLRSTYSNPYNWLFPFGKNSSTTRKTTLEDKPLKNLNENPVPEILEVRILRGIKGENIDPLIDTQRAISCYCQKVN